MYCLGKPSTLCIYFVIIIIITFLYISESINVFIYLVTYRPIGPGAFCVFVYVIVYNCVNVCTSHNNKPFITITTTLQVISKNATFVYPEVSDFPFVFLDRLQLYVCCLQTKNHAAMSVEHAHQALFDIYKQKSR